MNTLHKDGTLRNALVIRFKISTLEQPASEETTLLGNVYEGEELPPAAGGRLPVAEDDGLNEGEIILPLRNDLLESAEKAGKILSKPRVFANMRPCRSVRCFCCH